MKISVNERATKAGWHAMLAGLAVVEFGLAKTTFRKLLCGACAGWHAAAMVIDWRDE